MNQVVEMDVQGTSESNFLCKPPFERNSQIRDIQFHVHLRENNCSFSHGYMCECTIRLYNHI